jgi:hypothetical protein
MMRNAANIQEVKHGVDLGTIIEGAGIELRPAGSGRLRGLCPFHQEKTPSFFVFQDHGRWRCFGCGEHGDAIDFLRRSRGLSFHEALQALGVDDPKRTAAELDRIREERSRRRVFEWRERETARTLGAAIRLCHEALERITPENFESFALILDQLPILTYQHNTLIHGNPEDRAALVRELAGLQLFPRRLLFRRDFDFSAWLRSVQNNRGAENERRSRGTRGDSKGAATKETRHSNKSPGGELVPTRQAICD